MKIKPFSDRKLKKWVKSGMKFYCFGAGAKLRSICRRIEGLEENILAVGDNNAKLQGTAFTGNEKEFVIQDVSHIKPEEGPYVILLTTSFYQEVAKQLEESDVWKDVKTVYFFPHREEMHFYHFRWFYNRLKPQKKLLFRSGNYHYIPGWDYTDNARALFDYMVEKGYNREYKMIWMVHNPKDYPQINKIKNTHAISYEWIHSKNIFRKFIYFYHLRTSKYLFFTDAMYWTRFCGKEQIRVNLWHGNGFKAKKNKQGGALNSFFDYTTVSGPVYLDLHARYFGCDRNKVFDTGLAKEDLLFEKQDKGLDEILQIPKCRKYLFWLPTFRQTIQELNSLNEYEVPSETGMPILTSVKYAEQMNDLLAQRDMFLIIKLHPIQENSAIRNLNFSNIKVLTHVDIAKTGYQINSLLAQADALISDFSSAAVDYVLLDRPLAFVLQDEDLYKESRGFVFEPLTDYLPGKELYSFEDMVTFVQEVSDGIDSAKEKRHRIRSLMHTHQDGNSRERILKLIGLWQEEM